MGATGVPDMWDHLGAALASSLGGAYRLERELGGGGMSRVFVAHEAALGRDVVVKVLAPSMAEGLSAERFAREIRLAARLQEPHIVPVLSAGATADGLPYYTMPFVRGESLRARLASGPVPADEALGVLRDVLRALAYAHAHGVVHRDVKPENVLLSSGTAVVTDFGIAKALDAAKTEARDGPADRPADGPARVGRSTGATSGAQPQAGDGTLTQFGISLGTPAYMAPEQAAGDAVDARADLYAWGVIAYELLAGRHPFAEKMSSQQLIAAHLTEAPKPFGDVAPGVPPALGALVLRCLAKDPAARPESADAVLIALDAARQDAVREEAVRGAAPSRGMLVHAFGGYAAAVVAVWLLSRWAVTGIGLPEWVLPGAVLVMALGFPVVLVTTVVQHQARGARRPDGARAGAASDASPATSRLTWRRTTLGGLAALGAFVLIVAGYMALRALGIGPAGALFAQGVLAPHDRIVVTDFRVAHADSALGAVLAEAVRAGVGQSAAVSLVAPDEVADALRRMRRPPTTRLDLATAREIAARMGAKAVLDGDVAGVAGGYLVSLRLVSADSGRELASFHQAADGPSGLIGAADALTRHLRAKLGESLRRVNATPALAEVTTSSLDALRAYTAGVRVAAQTGDMPHAETLLRRAVALDTGFATAHSALGAVLHNQSKHGPEDSATARAFRLRARLPERERLLVEGAYYGGEEQRDPAKARAAYEALLDRGDSSVLGPLALVVFRRREFARAESLYATDARRDPSGLVSPLNLVAVEFNLGKQRQADSLLAAVRARAPRLMNVMRWAVHLAYNRGDLAEAVRIADSARASAAPAPRAWGARQMAYFALLRGRVGEFERYTAQAAAVDAARGNPASARSDSIEFAYRDVWMSEDPARGLRRLDAALAAAPRGALAPDDYTLAAIGYAVGGRADRARAVLAREDAEVADTMARRLDAPARHRALGEIALAERRWREGIAELRRSDSTADGPVDFCPMCLDGMLGRAFDRAGQPDSALAAYERFVHTRYFTREAQMGQLRPASVDPYWLPPILKRLGELYEARGDRARAAASYARFVELWKDADPEFQPLVADVRNRLERLAPADRPR